MIVEHISLPRDDRSRAAARHYVAVEALRALAQSTAKARKPLADPYPWLVQHLRGPPTSPTRADLQTRDAAPDSPDASSEATAWHPL